MAYKKSPVDITNRTVHRSRISKVGIELEGAWKELPAGVICVDSTTPSANQLGRDGSLTKPGGLRDRLDYTTYPYVGELPSPPLKESEVNDWLTSHYPAEVGPECGMHVHISLTNPLVYMWLMDDEAYPATVVEYIKQWALREQIPTSDPIWDRLAGNCEYCQHIFWPSEQVRATSKDYSKTRRGHRYTAINFAFARETGTIECRLLSQPKTVEQAQRAVKEFISITNRYLVATAKRERKQVSAVIVDSPAYELTLNASI